MTDEVLESKYINRVHPNVASSELSEDIIGLSRSEYLKFCRPLQRFGSCCVPETVVFVLTDLVSKFTVLSSQRDAGLMGSRGAKNGHVNYRCYSHRKTAIFKR